MPVDFLPQIAVAAAAGLVGGLALLVRGFRSHGTATRLADTSTSRIASIAAGEVRISGLVEPAEATLVSPIQSVACVYYRGRIRGDADGDGDTETLFDEQRAVGFRVRDDSGTIRVFPRAAAWDVPDRFDERSGLLGETPLGVSVRAGSAFAAAVPDRAVAIASLLTVRPVAASDLPGEGDDRALDPFAGFGRPAARTSRGRRWTEARIEPGERVTILGRAVPFASLADPTEADVDAGPVLAADDAEVLGDIAEARAAGLLETDPREAWGNAAIPGFGIGQPVTLPELDPRATPPSVAPPEAADRARMTFEIAPETLVVAAGPDVPLVVALGGPEVSVRRYEDRFLLGLLGAVLAIGSAIVLALSLSARFG